MGGDNKSAEASPSAAEWERTNPGALRGKIIVGMARLIRGDIAG